MAKWLMTKIELGDDLQLDLSLYQQALEAACQNGHLQIVKWLYEYNPRVLDKYTKRYTGGDRFSWQPPDPISNNEILLNDGIPAHVVLWLLSLHEFELDILDSYLPKKYYNLAFAVGYKPNEYYYKLYPAYTEYRDQLFSEIRESKYQSPTTTIFEVRGLPEMILAYV
jgi:hypothetical protein